MLEPIYAYRKAKAILEKESTKKILKSLTGDAALEHKQFLEREFPDPENYNSQYGTLNQAEFALETSFIARHHCNKMGIRFEDLFKLNSSGLRSDEFVEEHNGKRHILFAGCSNTFGDSLPLEYTWAHKAYLALSESDGGASGYFNIARPGATPLQIFLQVLKYVSLYGCPDIVFIMLPDSEREPLSKLDFEASQELVLSIYNIMMSTFEKSGTRTIIYSWDARANIEYHGDQILRVQDARTRMYNNFFQFNVDEREQFLYARDHEDNSGLGIFEPFLLVAMDNNHPGIAENEFYFNFAMDIYNNLVEPSTPYVVTDV